VTLLSGSILIKPDDGVKVQMIGRLIQHEQCWL